MKHDYTWNVYRLNPCQSKKHQRANRQETRLLGQSSRPTTNSNKHLCCFRACWAIKAGWARTKAPSLLWGLTLDEGKYGLIYTEWIVLHGILFNHLQVESMFPAWISRAQWILPRGSPRQFCFLSIYEVEVILLPIGNFMITYSTLKFQGNSNWSPAHCEPTQEVVS